MNCLLADNSHEMPSLFFLKKNNENKMKMLSDAVVINALRVKYA